MTKYKILLDENIPQSFKQLFSDKYVIKTIDEMGWKGRENGVLLRLMVKNGFNVFVTNDKNLTYQNAVENLPITVFVLDSPDNRKQTLKKYLLAVVKRLNLSTILNGVVWIQI